MEKILFLIKSLKTPSSRIRIVDLLPLLREKGFDADIFEIPKDRKERRRLFEKASAYPVTVLQKRLLKKSDFKILRKNSQYLIFDFDDAIYCRNASPSERKSDYYSFTRRRLFKNTVRNCDTVIAANHALSEKALRTAPGQNVGIVPSSIDTSTAKVKSDYNMTGPVILGWIGTKSTLRYLKLIDYTFKALSSKYDILLRIVSDKAPEKLSVKTEFIPWELETQYDEIAKFDIGIMPLSSDPFSEGKAAYKLLQYMASGVPSVCSPVGMNAEVAGNNEFCLIAETPEDFRTAIVNLIENPQLREKLGKAGRKLVTEKYSREAAANRLVKVLRDH